MMKKILFSCQNNQEFTDLAIVAVEMKNKMGIKPILYDLEAMTGYALDNDLKANFERIYKSVNFYKKFFCQLNPLQKFTLSFANALNIFFILKKEHADVAFIGVPLLVFRLLSFLSLGSISLVSYIRGVIVKSEVNTSISSKINIYFRFLSKIYLIRRIFCDYYADLVFCIGRTTRNFILSRGVPEKNVYVVGSIYCDVDRSVLDVNSNKKEVVFVTSAFSHHGYIHANSEQKKIIKNIYTFFKGELNDEVNFKVRIHPRENMAYYSDLIRSGVFIERSTEVNLNSYSKNDTLFLSVVSTLLFELAYLGYKTEFISNDWFNVYFRDWYDSLGLTPKLDFIPILTEHMNNEMLSGVNDYGQVISCENKGLVKDAILSVFSGTFRS